MQRTALNTLYELERDHGVDVPAQQMAGQLGEGAVALALGNAIRHQRTPLCRRCCLATAVRGLADLGEQPIRHSR